LRRTVIHLEQKTAETELRLGGWEENMTGRRLPPV